MKVFKSFHSEYSVFDSPTLCDYNGLHIVIFLHQNLQSTQQKFAFYTLIAVHLQILLSLILYFISPNGI